MFDITTVGSITLDTFIKPKEIEFFSKNNTDYFGFEVGGKIKHQTTSKFIGGGAANSAVGFSTMGFSTAIVGTLGKDDHGKFIAHELLHKNINETYLQWQTDKPSSSSIILTMPDGRRTVLHERTTALPITKIPDTKALYIGHLARKEETIFDLIPQWKTNEKVLAWNPGKTQFEQGINAYKSMCQACDIIILNKEEAALFTKQDFVSINTNQFEGDIIAYENNLPDTIFDVSAAAHTFLTHGINQIVITDSRRGAQYFSAQHPKGLLIPQIDMTQPVSTLGAGDSFSVGVVSAFLHQKSPHEMLVWGSINASSVVQSFGAQNGLLPQSDIETACAQII